jgi:hypothetical protein
MVTTEEDGGFWPNLEFATHRQAKRITGKEHRLPRDLWPVLHRSNEGAISRIIFKANFDFDVGRIFGLERSSYRNSMNSRPAPFTGNFGR